MNWSLSYCPQVGVLGHLFGGPKHVSLILRIIDGKYNYDLGFDATLNFWQTWCEFPFPAVEFTEMALTLTRLHSLCLT